MMHVVNMNSTVAACYHHIVPHYHPQRHTRMTNADTRFLLLYSVIPTSLLKLHDPLDWFKLFSCYWFLKVKMLLVNIFLKTLNFTSCVNSLCRVWLITHHEERLNGRRK